MLPFLQPKKMSGLIIAKVKPDGGVESQGQEDEVDPGLMAAAQDLISAVHAKNTKDVASALKAAFAIADAEPHAEGPHEEG